MDNQDLRMIDEIKIETKIFKMISLKTLFVTLGFGLFGFFSKSLVYSSLEIAYIVFNILVGLTISLPSPFNRGKTMGQSMVLFVRNLAQHTIVYHAIAGYENLEQDQIRQSNLMYDDAK